MPGGVWNKDELPVMEWGAAEHRVVLADSLQRVMGIDTPVLRWSVKTYCAAVETHEREIHVVRNLAPYLARWEYAGEDNALLTFCGYGRKFSSREGHVHVDDTGSSNT